MASANFHKAAQLVMNYEGGIQNLSSDSGNHVNGHNVGTNHGISGQTLNDIYYGHMDKNGHHVGHEKFLDGTKNPYYQGYDPQKGQQYLDAKAISNLTIDQAQNIMNHEYWGPIHGDAINPKLATPLFDSAINNGVSGAIKQLQGNLAAAGLYNGLISGNMNAATIAAINNADPDVLYNFLRDARIEAYQNSPNSYHDSHVNRVNLLFPKEALTPDQQAQYQSMPTLKDLQEYLNTQFNTSLKVDGIWGDSTKNAFAQAGANSPGHSISPQFHNGFSQWFATNHPIDTPSVATQAVETPSVSTQAVATPSVATHSVTTSNLDTSTPAAASIDESSVRSSIDSLAGSSSSQSSSSSSGSSSSQKSSSSSGSSASMGSGI